ncbi:MAG: tRNA lysidine(34) synthetase TilS [Clostridia bacterium]|nr:tRNA lysidine(34) synthetase TilS [Clostridia bacterium]
MKNRRRAESAETVRALRLFEEAKSDADLYRGANSVVLALSGGKDSVCLFHLLRTALPQFGITLLAAHVNHNLRGKEALRDEAFCKRLCEEYGVEYRAFSVDAAAFSEREGLSLEAACRSLRYDVLLDFCKERGALLATAHTKSDQAETVLMQICKGGGLTSACGIAKCREDGVIRPLLGFSTQDVKCLCRHFCWEHVTDSTNRSTRYLRNFYREKLLPLLKKKNPSVEECLARFSENCRAEHTAYQRLSREYLAQLGLYPAKSRMDKQTLAALANDASMHAVLYDALLGMLTSAGCRTPLSQNAFLRVTEALRRPARIGARVQVGQGVSFVFEQDSLFVFAHDTGVREQTELCEGGACFGDAVFSLVKGTFSKESAKVHKIHTSVYVSCDKIIGCLSIRLRRAGDTYTVRGQERTLKDLFSTRRIPQALRDSYPLVCDDEGVVWVPGELAADRVRAEEGVLFKLELQSGSLFEELQKRRQYE